MLNRIMVKKEEVGEHGIVRFPPSDNRFVHASSILGCRDGDTLRAGVLDEGIDDGATVRWCWPLNYSEGWLVDSSADSKAGSQGRKKPGKSQKQKVMPEALELQLNISPSKYPRPRVDLMLALPRPLQLQRMLPIISSMGVDTLVLTNAAKVEKDYFGSHLMRDEDARLTAIVEGLAQSGEIHVPRVVIARRLKPFLEDDCDDLFGPPENSLRLVAHPYAINGNEARHFHDIQFGERSVKRVLLAVGPEGGWEESFELPMLSAHGFQPIVLGPRILRSDVAVTALMALAHEKIAAAG